MLSMKAPVDNVKKDVSLALMGSDILEQVPAEWPV